MDGLIAHTESYPSAIGVCAVVMATLLWQSWRRWRSRSELLPGVMATALFAFAVSIAHGTLVLMATCQGIALTGSGGVGAIAAGLSEARYLVFVGAASAVLALGLGAVLAMTQPQDPQVAENAPADVHRQRLAAGVPIIAVAGAVALAVLDHRSAAWMKLLVHRKVVAPMPGEMFSQSLAHHLLGTTLFASLLAVVAVILVIVMHYRVTPVRRGGPFRLIVSASLLLMLAVCLVAAIVSEREQVQLWEIALTGRPLP